MVCPTCSSTDVRRLSLIRAAGMYRSGGRIRGLLFGSIDGLVLGHYRGTSQTRLSRMVGPPMRLPFVLPLVLWFIGFLPIMAFAGGGKLTTLMAIVSVGYLLLLPCYLLVALVYNLFVHPGKYRRWEGTWMCQSCGALIDSPSMAKM